MTETMHRLRILDPAEWYSLPAHVQARHLAHVANDLAGSYEGRSAPTRPHADMLAEAIRQRAGRG